jgi:enoyl-CoA hydratase
VTETQDILFKEVKGKGGNIGLITLNRQAALNSLNHDMITALSKQLKKWATAASIKAVVICAAEGRAFCAGGDIRLVYDRARENDSSMTEFFHEEYLLNRVIFHFPKPYIAFLDGITMGGGVGISIHGSHRVGTENLLFAMPETGIGFFPDVGGTYFLPRLPNHIGYYLGLTGARLKIDDCMSIGLTTNKVDHDDLPDLLNELVNTQFDKDAHASVTEIISEFSNKPIGSALEDASNELEHCFSAATIESLLERLQTAEHPICVQALSALQKKSPTSLKVTLTALIHGKNMDFDECMRQEFRLVSRFLLAHDFIEGIRALIIDKDQTPIWQPKTLSDVSTHTIEDYFAPLTKELA